MSSSLLERRTCHAGLPLVALLFACGGGAGGGCGAGCLAPTPGGFPADDRRHEGAVQLRATGGALQYLSDNGAQVAGVLLPGGATQYPVPACPGQLCCGGANCSIDIRLKGLTLAPSPPRALALTTRVALASMNDVQVTFAIGPLTTRCHLTLDTSKGSRNKDVGFSGDLSFDVDPATHLTRLSLQNPKIVDLEAAMLTLKPVNQITDFLQCNLGNLSFVQNILVGQIASQVSSQVDASLCQSCLARGDCDGLADDCRGGQCMRQGKCLQEVGLQGRLELSSLSPLLAGSGAKIDLIAVLGSYAASFAPGVNGEGGGLALGMLGGDVPAAHHPCVPVTAAPATPVVPRWSQEMAGHEPQGGKPYHVGIGIHQSHLDTMGWAAFDAGAFCLEVGTAQSAMLDSASLGLLMPSLGDLTHGEDAPMLLSVRPQQPPHITLGKGTFKVDPMTMKRTIDDPLLHVELKGLAIDFHALVEDRYVRLLRLTADANLPIALDTDDKGQIVPLLGDLGGAFTNLVVTDSELLKEDPAQLARAFPVLLALAGGQLGALPPVALPKVMGLSLSLVAVEPVDEQSFLGLFADLSASPDAFHAGTLAEVRSVVVPPTSAFSVVAGLDAARQPRVLLAVSGRGHAGDDRDLEYSVRLDGGLWMPYQRGPLLEVIDPRLWLQGRHPLEVRARVVGEPRTTDPEPVRLEAIVDTVAPRGTFDVAGSELAIEATDAVSGPARLGWRARLSGGGWTAWRRLPGDGRVTVPEALAEPPEVQLRDEAGNEAGAALRDRTEEAAPGGCAVGGGWKGSRGRRGAAMALAILLVVLGRRRHLRGGAGRAVLLALVLVVPLVAAACSADEALPTAGDAGSGDGPPAAALTRSALLDPADEIGRFTDALAAAGVIHVSAYDSTWGDLAYAAVPVADVGKPIAWQWVDGVPDDGTVPAASAYRRGSAKDGDDVGLYTSLALDRSGAPRIAYYDATHRALKYGSADATRAWKSHTVATVSSVTGGKRAFAGKYAALSLDGADVPSIAFMATGIPDGKGGVVARLRLATAKSAAPSGPDDWTVIDLDEASVPCADLCPAGQACLALDPLNADRGTACKATGAGCAGCTVTQACIAGGCVEAVQVPAAVDLDEGTGLFAGLTRLPGGLRAIAYHDRTAGACKLASEGMGGRFTITTVDGSPGGDAGRFVTARATADGAVHLAYVDAVRGRLLYKAISAGVVPPAEVIDDGQRPDGPHLVGAGAALWTDGMAVRVAYQDQQRSDLMVATRASGAWSRAAARAGTAGYGFYPRIVSDGGKLFVVQLVIDRAAAAAGKPLASVQIASLP